MFLVSTIYLFVSTTYLTVSTKKTLYLHVLPCIYKALYKERVTSDFKPFRIAGGLAIIENYMWE